MNITAKATDRLLYAYGTFTPQHPGKWRVFSAFEHLAEPAWNKVRCVKRHGITFELDLHDRIPRDIYYNVGYESAEFREIRKLVKKGETVIDAGAHIGYFSLHFSRMVGETGQVNSFEPCEETRRKLLRNLELNRLINVTVFNSALGDREGTVGIDTSTPQSTGRFHVTDQGSVPMTTIDNVLNGKPVHFIKVDVEGSELRLLRGAAKSLSSSRPNILIELNESALLNFGTSSAEVCDLLRSFGYRLLRPLWYGVRPLEKLPAPGDYFNILASPA